MSILLSAEMEVDGDLKVTGTVESTTIDSLKAVIADLQSQFSAIPGIHVKRYEFGNGDPISPWTAVKMVDEVIENSNGILLLGINLFIQGSPFTTLTLQSETLGCSNLKKITGGENDFGYIWSHGNCDGHNITGATYESERAVSAFVPIALIDDNTEIVLNVHSQNGANVQPGYLEIYYFTSYIQD